MKMSTEMKVKGYRGKVTLEDVKKFASQGIYLFNAKSVVGREHIMYAYEKAERVFDESRNIAKNMHIEMMLILTGKRQINDALGYASPLDSQEFVAVSLREFELPFQRDDSVVQCTEEKLKYLGIQIPRDMEREKICLLAFENSALLEVMR